MTTNKTDNSDKRFLNDLEGVVLSQELSLILWAICVDERPAPTEKMIERLRMRQGFSPPMVKLIPDSMLSRREPWMSKWEVTDFGLRWLKKYGPFVDLKRFSSQARIDAYHQIVSKYKDPSYPGTDALYFPTIRYMKEIASQDIDFAMAFLEENKSASPQISAHSMIQTLLFIKDRCEKELQVLYVQRNDEKIGGSLTKKKKKKFKSKKRQIHATLSTLEEIFTRISSLANI